MTRAERKAKAQQSEAAATPFPEDWVDQLVRTRKWENRVKKLDKTPSIDPEKLVPKPETEVSGRVAQGIPQMEFTFDKITKADLTGTWQAFIPVKDTGVTYTSYKSRRPVRWV